MLSVADLMVDFDPCQSLPDNLLLLFISFASHINLFTHETARTRSTTAELLYPLKQHFPTRFSNSVLWVRCGSLIVGVALCLVGMV